MGYAFYILYFVTLGSCHSFIKLLDTKKREDCILFIHIIRLLALPTQMDKQQPLTLVRYVVIPFVGMISITCKRCGHLDRFVYSNFARI